MENKDIAFRLLLPEAMFRLLETAISHSSGISDTESATRQYAIGLIRGYTHGLPLPSREIIDAIDDRAIDIVGCGDLVLYAPNVSNEQIGYLLPDIRVMLETAALRFQARKWTEEPRHVPR